MSVLTTVDVIRAGATPLGKKEATKPCPFCGTDPNLPVEQWGWLGDARTYAVSCENDDCAVSVQVNGKTPSEALERWNRRAG